MTADSTRPMSAWLFMEDDDGSVGRLPVRDQRIHLGRDQSNDIRITHPGSVAHVAVIYERDGDHFVKVYDGARLTLNGSQVTGMHRLYGGDKIRVGDRTLMYGRSDSPPDQCVAVTVFRGGEAQRAWVFKQTEVTLGRHRGDVALRDIGVSEEHVTLELYALDHLFVVPNSRATPVQVQQREVRRRKRVDSGQSIDLGRVTVRVTLVPGDAFGLMKALRPADMVRKRRHKFSPRPAEDDHAQAVHEAPSWEAPPDPDEVPPTVVGSLAMIEAMAATEAKRTDVAVAQTRQRGSGAPDRAPPVPKKRRSEPPPPSVKLSPGLLAGGEDRRDPAQGRRPGAPTKSPPLMQAESPPQEVGFHDRSTDLLFMTGPNGMLTQVHGSALPPDLDGRMVVPHNRGAIYRPSREGAGSRELAFRVDERAQNEPIQPPSRWSDERQYRDSPAYRPSRERHEARASAPVEHHLTGIMAIQADRPRLDRQVHRPDPDAMAEPDRHAYRRRQAGKDVPLGYSHHDPHRRPPPPVQPAGPRGPVDDGPRRLRIRAVDDSPRYLDDEER